MLPDFYKELFHLEKNHWWWIARRNLICHLIGKLGMQGKGLDVGCGAGLNLALFPDNEKAIGFDLNLDALKYASLNMIEHRKAPLLFQGRIESMPFREGSFDFVTALDILEHLENDLFALRKMKEVVKKGGLIVLTVPAHQWMWGNVDRIGFHKRRYSAKAFRKLIAESGMKSINLFGFNSALFFPISLVRLFHRATDKLLGPGQQDLSRNDFRFAVPKPFLRLLHTLFILEFRYLTPFWPFAWGVSFCAVLRNE